MQLSGLITGTLGYSLKREFLANAIAFREVENFNYDIYSVDIHTFSADEIQKQIKNQFSQVYSGDINVGVFSTQHTYSFNSDSLRAAKYNVSIEIRKPIQNLASFQPELASGYYSGIDASFISGYGPYLIDFRESFALSNNSNGNREFGHDVSFGLRTGWGPDSATQSGRKSYAQSLVSGIFAKDKSTPFGLSVMSGQLAAIADNSIFRNYYTESYDLIRNTYSFARKRELLPFDAANAVVNLNNSLSLNTDGTIEVTEKATTQGKINFSAARSNLESYISTSFSRCSGIYHQFYNSGVIMQDAQYSLVDFDNLLPLINIPVKTIKNYDARSLSAAYEISYTNNPTFSGNSATITQNIEFNIDSYDRIEASHTYDFVVNRAINDSGYFVTLMNLVTGDSSSTMGLYYTKNFSDIKSIFPKFNLIKTSVSWPNIKTKSSVKFAYSNNPSYMITYDGMFFRILDYSIEDKIPTDIVNEYEIVNRPTKMSVLTYGYQTEKGEVSVNLKISLGKQSKSFYIQTPSNFLLFNGYPLSRYLQAVYKLGGELLMSKFKFPTTALNWFINDSKFNLDSEGNLNVQLNYVYTFKKRSASIYR